MNTTPEGYKRNSVGHLVPIGQIKEIDLLRDDFVSKAVLAAEESASALLAAKKRLIGDMDAFLNLSGEKYGVKLGVGKGNISLTSFDGKYRITRDVAERIEFDERLQAAKELVDQCLREWTRDSNPNIRALIEDAFQVDRKGRINTKRILGLRKLKIDHPTWATAMDAISEAITITGSCVYHRFYVRNDETGKYQQIVLDFAAM